MFNETAFWDGIAEKYSRQPVADPAAFERKIAITRAHIKPSDLVLDIGCGTGSLALRLAPDAAHVHGLDVSTEMIRIANRKAAAEAIRNVTFHVGPFDESAPFEPASLDVICAYNILHLLADWQLALSRIYKLLKPGGVFVSSTHCLAESALPFATILSVMRWLKKAPSVCILHKRSLLSEMERAGFIDVKQPDVGAKSRVAFVVAAKPA